MPFRRLLALLAALAPLPLAAQSAADSIGGAGGGAADPVRAVRIERHDIFDAGERGWLARLANGLHIMTRSAVIRRELLVQPGEPYDSARVAESERNLRALGIFRKVEIDSVRGDSGLVLRVVTRDGWSTKLDYRFRSTGGEVALTIGLVEQNLLGTATSAAARYSTNPDRSTVALGFRRARLVANRVGLAAAYEDRSDGRLTALTVDQPFFSLSSAWGFRVEGDDEDERVLRFFEGEEEARDTVRRHFTLGRVTAAWAVRASPAGYLRVGGVAQLRREDFRPESSTAPLPRSVTAAVGPFLLWSRARFLVAQGVGGFAREEDVDIGASVRAGLLLAPAAFGYERDGIGAELHARVGSTLPTGFGYVEVATNGLYTAAGLDSGSVQVGATAVLQPGSRHTAILHAEAGWQEDPAPGREFDLGLGTGPRAFGSHSFTGDRLVLATAEYRYMVTPDFLGLAGVGVAGFVDHGGAWYAGSRRRLGWDAGVGLRLGLSRASDTDALRFDLARRFATDVEEAGWVVAVGKAFVFSPLARTGF